jgi:hypothetical protein
MRWVEQKHGGWLHVLCIAIAGNAGCLHVFIRRSGQEKKTAVLEATYTCLSMLLQHMHGLLHCKYISEACGSSRGPCVISSGVTQMTAWAGEYHHEGLAIHTGRTSASTTTM